MNRQETPHLAKVYAAKSPDELKDAYRDWAESYDRETLTLGYCTPFVILAWLARYVPANAGEILDAGCGTGLSGPLLKAMGYPHLTGLDFSADMLRSANIRNTYHKLVEAELGRPLPLASDSFAAIICSGVFTLGHAPASAFHELVRILKPGGHIVFSLHVELKKTPSFQQVIGDLTDRRSWVHVESSAPFRPFAVGEPDTLAQVHIYKKC